LRHSAYPGWRKHLDVSVVEVTRALDGLEADGVVPPASSASTNPAGRGQDDLFAALNARSAVAFVLPANLARPHRARPAVLWCRLPAGHPNAYLLVPNGIRCKYTTIRFTSATPGGLVPFASHLTAVAILGDTGTSSADAYHNSVFSGTCWRSSIASVVAPLWRVLGGMRWCTVRNR